MNKTIIALATAAAIAAPVANANVTIYGKVHVSVDHVDQDGSTVWNVMSRASRIGFKGTEDLGNGLSLIWKAETTYDFLSTGKLDLFADTLADNNSTIGFHDVRADNAIAYISPNMNGLTVAAAIIAKEGQHSDTGLADAYSIAAMYSNNGLYLSAAYEDLGGPGNSIDHVSKWRVGAGYTMNAFTLNGIYESRDRNNQGTQNHWQVQGGYSFGNNVAKAMYGVSDSLNDSNKSSWALGLDHKLSKRTSAYALYVDSEHNLASEMGCDSPCAGDGFSFGMIHNF
ncbi:hypothetical protein BOW49_10845 [Solemya velum gill symbiont]|uniref:porin n=1 Tax=Solemya velum gill symbiont TaxID=2340 RepID=UPI0009983E98|nr:porin [Solemya velum gill symbiont]OOZ72547.1 hypothetical protein BOW49_10845 [Solemya velum gill symbiont]